MKRPSFQFYPGDWTINGNLRRCTHAEKGVWLEVMCLMHDQEEYGVLRWPLKEIAQAVGSPASLLKALHAKGVLKGDDKKLEAALTYTPRSGRRDGETVTLLAPQDGPVWFSSRMVKDEYVRTIRGEGSRFGGDDSNTKDGDQGGKGDAPKPPFGDGASSSSSSSSSNNTHSESSSSPGAALPDPTKTGGMAKVLRQASVGVHSQNPYLLAWVADGFTPDDLLEAVTIARAKKPAPQTIPAAYLDAVIRSQTSATPTVRGKKVEVELDAYGIPL